MTHGYARCSTNEDRQDINRQTRELKKQGVERVWLEFEHGDTISKEQQKLMLNAAEPGDTIITLEVSRLARSTKQLCEIIDIIRDKHLRLIIVGSITMDCRDGQMDPMTEAFLQIAGVFFPTGVVHDPGTGPLRSRERQSEGEATGAATCIRGINPGQILSVLQPVSGWQYQS